MTDDDVVKIRVGNGLVGVTGLWKAMEDVVRSNRLQPDSEISEAIGLELLKRLSDTNYIPRQARDLYAKALVKEFKRYLGQPVPEDSPEGLQVAVLGPGCARCSQLEADVREAMVELKVAGDLSHVDDYREIARYGVMGVPALVINDRVVSAGQMPSRLQIKAWLKEAINPSAKE